MQGGAEVNAADCCAGKATELNISGAECAGFVLSMNDTDKGTTEEAISTLLAQSISKSLDRRTSRLVKGMIGDALSMVENGIEMADLKLVAAAFSEIRDALERFGPYRATRKVTVFGSARTAPDEADYALARNFASKIADAGFMVITGAGPGIMEACQRGAGRERSFGVNIRLPFEQDANEVIRGDAKLVEFKYFFTRKLFFLKEASALVLFPGGFGTHDEMFECLTLIQTGKSQLIPVICLDVPRGTFWKTWDRYMREHLLRKGLISTDDLALFKITDDVDEAVREVTSFFRVYHSSRFVRDEFVIRLNHELPVETVDRLSKDFPDIVGQAGIRQSAPLSEESDEPELADKPRLVFTFDKRSYGRLRLLIDAINTS